MSLTNRRMKNIAYIAGLLALPVVGFLIVLRGSTWSNAHKTLAGIFSALWLGLFVFALLQAPPTVSITNMRQLAGGLQVDAATKRLEGTINPASATLLINGKPVATAADGSFVYDVPLRVGDNTVRVRVLNQGKETVKAFHIYRLSQQESAYASQTLEIANSAGNIQQSTRVPAAVAADRTIQAVAGVTGKTGAIAKEVPKAVFGDGTFVVGTDIAAGTYRTVNADLLCTLQRITGNGDIVDGLFSANLSLHTHMITVRSTDATVLSRHCGTWTKI